MYLRGGTPFHSPGEAAARRLLLLQVLYTIRSARLLMEQLDYNLLVPLVCRALPGRQGLGPFRFFQESGALSRLGPAVAFFARILEQAKTAKLLSDEHFTVDGTLIEALASRFRPEFTPPPEGGGGRNPEVDFHGQKRSNSHACLDHRSRGPAGQEGQRQRGPPEPQRACPDGEPQRPGNLSPPHRGHRHRRAGGGRGHGGGRSRRHRITVGGDKAYDTARASSQSLRALKAVPHVAQNCRGPEVRRSTAAPPAIRGTPISQRLRKRVEEIFGWMKTVGNLRKTRHRGQDRVGWAFTLTAAAYNLVRIRNLQAAVSP